MSWPLEPVEGEPWEHRHAAREVDGGWLYTCRQAGDLRPLGDCSEHCRHPGPADAERHYQQYLLRSARFDGRWQGKEYRCAVCDAWTDRYAVLETHVAVQLCRAHLNRAGLEHLALAQALTAGQN
jgi:hypothetical protein